jgi:hypothetical protein
MTALRDQPTHTPRRRSRWASAAAFALSVSACGGQVLDFGSDVERPRYATPSSTAAEDVPGSAVATAMATHQYGAVSIALDDARIYWATNGPGPPSHADLASESAVVRSCVKTNCAGTVVTYATAPFDGHKSIAVDETRVYWGKVEPNTPIHACPIKGCLGAPTVIASHVSASSMVVDTTHVYWLAFDSTLQRCPVAGCGDSPELVTVTRGHHGELAGDATNLYWSQRSSGPGTGAIMTVAKDGSTPSRTIVDGLQSPTAVAVDATNVYWMETHSLGAVKTCPLAGCAGEPTTLATRQSFPLRLGLDGANAYWFNFDEEWWSGKDVTAKLVRCPLTGCGDQPDVLITHQMSPYDIALDKTHVYWTNFGETKPAGIARYADGAVMRVRIKP